jgi:predicted RNA-binding Zn ribbon-like protein
MPFRSTGRLIGNLVDVEAAELFWPLDNGRVCLDLIATVGERWHRSFERLRTVDDLAAWFRDTGLAVAVEVTHVDLVTTRELRAAAFAGIEAAVDGRRLPAWVCEQLNDFASVAPPQPRISPRRVVEWRGATSASCALSLVARDAIDLISSDELARVRQCADTDCARIFLDRSRAGTRRWCSMATCGNRAKARGHRARHDCRHSMKDAV